MSEFSTELTRLMDEHRTGVRQLARAVYVNAGHVSNLRSGKARPSEKLAAILDEYLKANGVLIVAAREDSSRTRNPGHAPGSDDLSAGHDPLSTAHPADPGDMTPVLRNMSRANVALVIAALREIQGGYLIADRLMGALSVTDAIRTHIPAVEAACKAVRGADRAEALQFACRFMEFCGWLHQDSGDLACAMH
jgi:hypothetical protein